MQRGNAEEREHNPEPLGREGQQEERKKNQQSEKLTVFF